MTNNILNLDDNKETEDKANETPSVQDQVKSALEALVGEGKKFKDEEELAKGKVEADSFINRLLDEQRQRDETIKELQEQLTQTKTQSQLDALRKELSERREEPEPKENTTPELATEDLESMVEKLITERETRNSAKENVDRTNEALVKHYGDPEKAARAVADKAKELGLAAKDIALMAAKSPTAALALFKGAHEKLVGYDIGKTSSVSPAHVSSNSLDNQSSKAQFDELRRKDPKTYWSPRVQNEIMKRMREGTYN